MTSLQVGGFKRKSMPSFSLHRLLYTYVRGRILTVNGVCFLPTPRRSEDHSCGPGQRISSVHLPLCLALCEPINCSTPGCPVHHQSLELTHTHVHWVGDAIQPSHPLTSPSPASFSLSQHQGLFQSVCSSHQVAKILEFQLQQQSFQWIFRTDFL